MHQSVPTNVLAAFRVRLDTDCTSDELTFAMNAAFGRYDHSFYLAVAEVFEAEAAVTMRDELAVVILDDNIIVF